MNASARSPGLLAALVAGALLAVAATATTLLLISEVSAIRPYLALFHSVVAVLLSVLLPVFVLVHLRKVVAVRKAWLHLSGFALLALLGVCVWTGARFVLLGNLERLAADANAHKLAGLGVLVIYALHWWSGWLRARRSGRDRDRLNRPALLKAALTVFVALTLLGGAMGGILFGADTLPAAAWKEPLVRPDYQYDYGDGPFLPSLTRTPNDDFVHPQLVGDSDRCVACHADIGEQWRASLHRQAASDPTYVTNINLLSDAKGISATRYCEGCHAPVALLSGELSPGGQHGGVAGTPANHEGVSCLSCHSMSAVINTKGVASFAYAPLDPYPFQLSDTPLARRIGRALMRISPQGHREAMSGDVVGRASMCATCHVQFMDKDMNDWGWVPMQNEYDAWLKSPYAGQNDARFASTSITRCQDCHMPLIASSDPAANAQGMVRSHRFAAANTVVPYLNGDNEQYESVVRFLQANKMRASIKKPYRDDATTSAMALDPALRDEAVRPWYFYQGENATIAVLIANVGVGHNFPAGTTDLGEAWVAFRVSDADGVTVFERGVIEPGDSLAPDNHVYRSLPVDRFGKRVWKHDLFNKVGEVSRNVIAAGESDLIEFEFFVPQWAKGPLSVTATLKYNKLNARYARWALKDDYQPVPAVDMARAHLQVPLRAQREVQTAVGANR